MKKILFYTAALAIVAGCGKPQSDKEFTGYTPEADYYCQTGESIITDDPAADFDTLSYAMGMNLGLGISIQQAEVGFNTEAVRQAIAEELAKSNVDHAAMAKNQKRVQKFSSERIQPLMMQKRMNSRIKTDCPDTLSLPEVFNEEYACDEMSRCLGVDIAHYVRSSQMPTNISWLIAGMVDADKVSSFEEIDANMRLSQEQMGNALRNYFSVVLPAEQRELSRAWLGSIAERENVEMLVVGQDTLYYRIDEAGGELKPADIRDTVALRFEMFTRRGTLVESTNMRGAERREFVDERVAELQRDTVMPEERRAEQIATLEESVEFAYLPKVTLQRFFVRGATDALKLIGEGGKITIWMPSTLAYGPRGNRAVLPNEAIVMSARIEDVMPYVAPDGAPAPGKAQIKKIMPVPVQ